MGNTYHRYNPSQKRIETYAPSVNGAQVYQATEPSEILPYLYLGGMAVNQNPSTASYLGLTHILNMAYELKPHYELFNNTSIKYKHIPADDSLNYNMRYHFEEAFELIDDARKSNGKILVHCAMGISRSATIVIAYVMSRYGLPLRSAYDYVKSRRVEVRPNPLFMRILEEFEQDLLNQSRELELKRVRPYQANVFMRNLQQQQQPQNFVYRSVSYYRPNMTRPSFPYAY